VRRRAAAVLIVSSVVAVLLVAPRAPGLPDVPGDPTPPVVTPVITGTLGNAGWYTSNVTINWSVSDPESVILSTTGCNATTLTSNTAGTQLSCTAESDGGTTSIGKTFKVDKTPPASNAFPSRTADVNGWYNKPLSVSFAATDGMSGVDSCAASVDYAGPDTTGTPVAGTCRDVAGNTSSASQTVKYDATSPSATASARAPDSNGWFNHAVTVTFNGVDGTSGVGTCTQQTYSGPDDPSVALAGTCTDNAGNVSPSRSFTLKYDETAPTATATPSRAADVNGWHNHALTVSFSGNDATSGLESCDAPKSYSGPDSATASLAGACRDLAGNVSPRSFAFKYDGTAPAVTATAARAANTNGWYSAPIGVSFSGTDAVAGVASCSAAKTYSGPDNAAAEVTGSCTDAAGNVGGKALTVRYDATAPQVTASAARAAGPSGWYTAPVAVGFGASDATSGVDTCDADKTYSGPDSSSAAVGGTCRDKAGNSAAASLPLKYDATKPTVTAAASRPAGTDGWYSAPVGVSFTGSDATSGLDTCDANKTYSGPDAAATAVAGSCRDKAGNTQNGQLSLKYDATAPQVTASASRAADANGWYNHALSVSFTGVDATAGVDTCDAAKSYAGPDSAAATVAGSCRDKAGNAASAPLALKYDATAPAVTGATQSRPPDAGEWYNRPLSLQFQGADGMSGVDGCTKVDYAGPDSATASVSGSCADKAGNQSATIASALKYDATAPAVTASPTRPADANGWYNHPVTVGFAGTDGTSGVKSCDAAKTFSGPDAASTSVTGSCGDNAGNIGSGSVSVKYDSTSPTASATASRPPNANGWYGAPLTVSFAGGDGLSGLDSCDAAKSYSGPDSAGATVAGSCRDRAGNTQAGSLTVKYDATAPAVTGATRSRPPDSDPWYNHALTLQFEGADGMSGVDGCTKVDYAGPDSATASVSGSCADKAGNQSATIASALKYDATAPAVTASATRPADANGWYNHPVPVDFVGTDPTSGVKSCDATETFAGPDAPLASVVGECRDNAGNIGSGSIAVKYDATGPTANATASRAPNAKGWYAAPLSVSFAGSDALSGLDSCDAAKSYSGPDSAAGIASGICRDKAGNTRTASLAVKYDSTAPVATAVAAREPDSNGWYNHAVAVGFDGTDATSGIEICSGAQTYGGPDTQSVKLSGSCHDQAGNVSTPAELPIKYDATQPQVTDAVAVRPPDRAGWYNRPIAFAVQAVDTTSGVATCPAVTYSGPDDAAASFAASCADRAGNRGVKSMPLRYDATAPATRAAPDRSADSNGWYNRPFDVGFAGEDAVSGLDSCSPPEHYEGPDSEVVVAGGLCTDRAGNVGLASVTAGYDATAPTVVARADRAPDASGWYNHPLVVAFQGADATSQVAECSTAGYSGPDSGAASVGGSCRDRAGNSSASSFALRYDGTAPSLVQVGAKAGNGTATITWAVSADAALVRVRRGETVVYTGAGTTFTDKGLDNGVLYRYAVTAYDEAQNSATSSVTVRPSGPLVEPAANAVVSRPPRLAWKPTPKATYYNVQLWRRGRILSLWPRGTSLQLPRRWTYKGRRYRLTDGRYRWYVWPGYGPRKEKRFGKLLGSSSFVVR